MSTKQIEGYKLELDAALGEGSATFEDEDGVKLYVERADTGSLDRGYYFEVRNGTATTPGIWVDRDHLAEALAHVDSFDVREPVEEEDEEPAPESEEKEKTVKDFIELYRPRPTQVIQVTKEFVETFVKEVPGGNGTLRPSYSVRTGQPEGMEVRIGSDWKLASLGDLIVFDPTESPRILVNHWQLEESYELAA